MNALLAIKPEFARKILSGEKSYEFRRTTFKDATAVDFIYLYSSSPEKRIVGGFVSDRVVEGRPENLWELFGDTSGIEDRDRFMDYFDGTETGYAIQIDRAYEFDEPVDPKEVFDDFVPPVSFNYLGEDRSQVLRRYVTESVTSSREVPLPHFADD
jgi:type I restriction enzyme S subunit